MTFGQWTQIKLLAGELRQRNPVQRNEVVKSRLLDVKRRALDLSQPFQAFIPYWMEQERQVFAAQGLPQTWPALSPAYAAWKAKRYPGKTILRRSDRLYQSLTTFGADTIAEGRPRSLRFGTRVPYWQFHETGTRRMPARPVMVLLPATWERLNRMVMEHLRMEGVE